jgi:hypothetical protein
MNNMEEILVFQFYNMINIKRFFSIGLLSITSINALFYIVLRSMNLKNQFFIFVDNNRHIYNQINSFRYGFYNLVKFNFFFFAMLTTGHILYTAYCYNFRPLKEEDLLKQNYQREILIYDKLFK